MFLHHEQVLRDKIDILSAGRVEDRVFEFLGHLVRRFGQYESKVSCRVPLSLTRAQVGHIVNVRVETIIRLISRWQKTGLLKWKKNEIYIENWPLLEKSLRTQRNMAK
jgi:CRP/FNR family transcriptional regulator